MSLPEVTCSADLIRDYGAAETVQLGCTATNSPTSFRWELRSAPEGSTAFSETRADFVNGVATIQNPEFLTDTNVEGTYCFECVATNASGSSTLVSDKENAQQNVVVRTELYQLTIPNDYQWRWGDYNSNNFFTLEDLVDLLKVTSSDTTSEPLNDKITVTNGLEKTTTDKGSGNLALQLSPTYGTSANTVCQGNDSRLSDARAPTAHNLAGTEHSSDTLANLNSKINDATLIDTSDSRLSDARTPTGSASGDLTGTYPGPTVDTDTIDNTKLANMAEATFKGRAAGSGTGDPVDLTSAQATAMLNTFTDSLNGLVPLSGGGTANFLRADGSWTTPSGVGGGSPLTSKGDLYTFDTSDARLPVGADGQFLTVDSAEATGLKWTAVSGGSVINLWRYLDATNLPTGAAAPEAVWQFDGTGSELNDRTANGHNLTLIGSNVYHSAAEGLVGFAGYNDFYFSIANGSTLVTDSAYTFEVIAVVSEDARTVFLATDGDNTSSSTTVRYYISWQDSLHKFQQQHFNAAPGTWQIASHLARAIVGSVQYFAFTRSSNGLTYKVYADGQFLDSKSVSYAPDTGVGTVSPYLFYGASINRFVGSCFCMRFTKEEWSASQILESYKFCRQLTE